MVWGCRLASAGCRNGTTAKFREHCDDFLKNAGKLFIGWITNKRKHEEKRPLGRLRRRCGDNIRTDLRETGWEGVDRIHL